MTVQLMIKRGRRYIPAARSQVLEAAQAFLVADILGVCVKDPTSAKGFLTSTLAPRQSETFGVLWLDTRHRVIAWCELFAGTIDRAMVTRAR